jgi:hypothetical protein
MLARKSAGGIVPPRPGVLSGSIQLAGRGESRPGKADVEIERVAMWEMDVT